MACNIRVLLAAFPEENANKGGIVITLMSAEITAAALAPSPPARADGVASSRKKHRAGFSLVGENGHI